jgi:two-component system, LytTR family, response regulator AlgR
MLRTLIVDDEPLAVDRLIALCKAVSEITVVGVAQNGAQALTLTDTLRPDLVLLDIGMPEISGMQVGQKLAALPDAPAVIFVTAFADFALEAFDIAAVDYLLKPVVPERLQRAVDRVRLAQRSTESGPAMATGYANEFWIPHRAELIRIASSDIEKVEAERDYMRIHVNGRSYLLHQTITALEARLDPLHFIRLHRSSIVRRDLITRLGHDGAGAWHAEMQSGDQIRIGRTYLQKVKALAGK